MASLDRNMVYLRNFQHFSHIATVFLSVSQPAFTCSKSTVETLEQGVKYVQS